MKRTSSLLGIVGLALLVIGLLMQTSGFSFNLSAASACGGGGTVVTGTICINQWNPNGGISNPTIWNSNQGQYISAQIVLGNNGYANFVEEQLVCTSTCGTNPTKPLDINFGGIGTNAIVWENITWPATIASAGGGIYAGEGAYAVGATFQVTWIVTLNGQTSLPLTLSTGVARIGQITITVVDFSISASPPIVPIVTGAASSSSTINIAPINGFTGTVALTNVCSAGLTCSLSTTTITTSGSSILSISSANTVGTLSATVTGTSSNLVHSVVITVTASAPGGGTSPDFSITASTTQTTINVGAQGTITITVTPLFSFSGTVTLSTIPSSGLTSSISPTSVTISGTASAIATLTVSATSPGTYTVIVTGTSGTTSHSLSILFAGSTSSSLTQFIPGVPLSVPLLFIISGAILAVIGFYPSKRKMG